MWIFKVLGSRRKREFDTKKDAIKGDTPKKVLFVATVVKMHIMPFHIPYLKMFQEMGWRTAVAARNDYGRPDDCQIPFCDDYYDIPFERQPIRRANITAYRALKKMIQEGEFDIIHCHTPVGGMLARLAAIGARKKGTKVIYTAHGFHFYKGAPLRCWLIYFPAEWILAHWTDVLVTINREDYQRAKKFGAKKVVYVPGIGLDIAKFHLQEGMRAKKREELGVKDGDFLLLSVGELSKRKNHEVVIEALAKLKALPEYAKIQYLICGQGLQEARLKNLADTLGVAGHVRFLGYREDVAELCGCSDLFLFMSLQEGLPVALMEAMACGLPAICSRIRGNVDLVEDGVSGCIVENTPDGVADAIKRLLRKEEERKKYSEAVKRQVQRYSLGRTLPKMKEIYLEALGGRGKIPDKKGKALDEIGKSARQ